MPMTHEQRDQQAAEPGPVRRRPRSRRRAGTSPGSASAGSPRAPARRAATGRGAGEASRRSNQPCSMSRARLTPGRRAGEAGALQQADRDDEALVAVGVEAAAAAVRLPNTAVRPRKKIVGASTPGIAAPGTRSSSFAARRTAPGPSRGRRASAIALHHAASVSRSPQRQRARAPSPSRADRATIAPSAFEQVAVAEQPEITGSRIPSTMKLSGLYSAIVGRRLEQQVGREEGASRGRGSRRRAGTAPAPREALPVRSAIAAPSPPKASADERDEQRSSAAPRDALLDRGAEDQPDRDEPERA